MKKIAFLFTVALVFSIASLCFGQSGGGDITSPTGIVMVSIPAGTFTMGSHAEEPYSKRDEKQHTVTLSTFSMSKYPVTQEQYQTIMGSNPSNFNGSRGKVPAAGEIQGKRPVERVSWYDALVFCNKLSVTEGLTSAYSIKGSTDPASWGTVPTSSNSDWNAVEIVSGSTGYRLPTEAQWEYACRAGKTGSIWPTNSTGWYSENSGLITHEVGKKSANAWGLYDMLGNVFEWCWDWYDSYPSGEQTNPMGAYSGTNRVFRGGCYALSDEHLRYAYRGKGYKPNDRDSKFGFRLVRP